MTEIERSEVETDNTNDFELDFWFERKGCERNEIEAVYLYGDDRGFML